MTTSLAISLRPMTDDDVELVAGLQTRANAHDGVEQIMTADELRDEIDDDTVRYDTDVRIAEVDGVAAGYAYTVHLPSDVGQERCYVFGTVLGEHRGQGIGRTLLQWGVARGREQLLSSGSDLDKFLRVDAYDRLEANHRLFARFGFTPVRWFEELIRPLTDLPPITDVDGLVALPWDAARDEEIRQAKNAAFEDHWGSTPTSEASWQSMVHGATGRPDLSWFVVERDTGRVVAHCLNCFYVEDEHATGRRDGWIDNLGTVREWRGKGVASMLVARSLHSFADAGFTHACIAVDGENPTGAARLYRALGFEPKQRSVTYEIRVS